MILKNQFLQKFRPEKVLVFSLFLIMSGCAAGTNYETAKVTIPALQSDMGRIFVYRTLNPFALLKPIVFTLDGKHIADSYVDTIIYHDITPGIHSVNYNNGRSKLSINVTKGKSVFIKYTVVDDSVAAGNILPTIVDPKIAELEIRTISLIEKKIRYPNELR